MGSNICGNCANFKPKPGEKLFNCTSAEHAALKYGMQVRADTRACDAFVPYTASPPPAPVPPEERRRPVGLCPRGRRILVLGLVMAVLLVSGLLYTCASTLISTPAPTPTPTPTAPGPGPTPVPAYIVEYYDIGEWAVSSQLACRLDSAMRTRWFGMGLESVGAPAGTKFVIVSATVSNANMETPYNIAATHFTLYDSEGRWYQFYRHRFDSDYFPGGTLYPGKTVSGIMRWTVPDYASGLEVSLTIDPVNTPKVIARWKLP